MSNRFLVAFGVESDLSSSKGPTNFEQRTHSNDLLSSRWFAQEVDCQTSGHCQWYDSNLSKEGHIKRNVSYLHQHRAQHRCGLPGVKCGCALRVSACLTGALALIGLKLLAVAVDDAAKPSTRAAR